MEGISSPLKLLNRLRASQVSLLVLVLEAEVLVENIRKP